MGEVYVMPNAGLNLFVEIECYYFCFTPFHKSSFFKSIDFISTKYKVLLLRSGPLRSTTIVGYLIFNKYIRSLLESVRKTFYVS